MSLQDGMAALYLEMPDRVPRTEYSAHFHWNLVQRVTGISVDENSPAEVQVKASRAFTEAWNYDLMWNIMVGDNYLGNFKTDMGHAIYQQGGGDFHEAKASPFQDTDDVWAFDPLTQLPYEAHEDIVRKFNENYDKRCAEMPNLVNMTGVYITCMSGLIGMLGWDILLTAMGEDSKKFGEFTNRYCQWISRYFGALACCKAPVVMIHDDIVWTSGAFVSPQWYREYIFPNYKKMFAPVLESGKRVLYTSDGTFTEFIDDIAASGVHGFVMEPTTDMSYIAQRYGKTHVFVGNADTRILLSGTKEDIRHEVKRCMDIGKKCPGFFMAVGNHIPPNTPVDHALWYEEAYEEMSRR